MNTNLILLVVYNVCNNASWTPESFDTIPKEIEYENYNESLSCHKAANSLPRCRPKTACVRSHPKVSIFLFIFKITSK